MINLFRKKQSVLKDEKIFATFQPEGVLEIIEKEEVYYPSHNPEYEIFKDIVGYDPVFMFELNDERNYLESILSITPSYPQKLIIVKTKNYSYINQTQWFAIKGGKCKEVLQISDNKYDFDYVEGITDSLKKSEVLGILDIMDLVKNASIEDKNFVNNKAYKFFPREQIIGTVAFFKEFWTFIYKYLPNAKYDENLMYEFTHSEIFEEMFDGVQMAYRKARTYGDADSPGEQLSAHAKVVGCIDWALNSYCDNL